MKQKLYQGVALLTLAMLFGVFLLMGGIFLFVGVPSLWHTPHMVGILWGLAHVATGIIFAMALPLMMRYPQLRQA